MNPRQGSAGSSAIRAPALPYLAAIADRTGDRAGHERDRAGAAGERRGLLGAERAKHAASARERSSVPPPARSSSPRRRTRDARAAAKVQSNGASGHDTAARSGSPQSANHRGRAARLSMTRCRRAELPPHLLAPRFLLGRPERRELRFGQSHLVTRIDDGDTPAARVQPVPDVHERVTDLHNRCGRIHAERLHAPEDHPRRWAARRHLVGTSRSRERNPGGVRLRARPPRPRGSSPSSPPILMPHDRR